MYAAASNCGKARRAYPPSGGLFRFRPSAGDGCPAELAKFVTTLKPVVKRLVLASPRGYCAGVERAVETVEQALELHGAPVYVRKQIVHNAHVVHELEERGAVFVETEAEVPWGAPVVFSAHGVAPSVYERARARRLRTIDATCPLVSKVHAEARHYAGLGYTIFLIGHAGHEEVEGTMGEAPDSMVLVESVEQAATVTAPQTERLVYLTQTTLSVDDTGEIVRVLRGRFPSLEAPPKEDICYATTNRQRAVKRLLGAVDLLLVIGSRNSSNSNRLVEVARAGGVAAHLIEDESEIEEAWLEGIESVGLTSGASAPESLVRRVVGWFRERGVSRVEALDAIAEDVFFKLPREVRADAVTRT
jgi:4-hydroxy-3-methylbut-2-en-1-yl diphosphate reductase